MTPTEFELFVKSLLVEQLNCPGVEIYHRKKIQGRRSSYLHEIDLSFEITVARTRVFVIVECKAYKKPVSVDDVMELHSRIDDIGAHKGMLVSTSGFTSGAVALADAHGIALIQIFAGQWSTIRPLGGQGPSDIWFNFRAGVYEDGQVGLSMRPVGEIDVFRAYTLDEETAGALLAKVRHPLTDRNPIYVSKSSFSAREDAEMRPLFQVACTGGFIQLMTTLHTKKEMRQEYLEVVYALLLAFILLLFFVGAIVGLLYYVVSSLLAVIVIT